MLSCATCGLPSKTRKHCLACRVAAHVALAVELGLRRRCEGGCAKTTSTLRSACRGCGQTWGKKSVAKATVTSVGEKQAPAAVAVPKASVAPEVVAAAAVPVPKVSVTETNASSPPSRDAEAVKSPRGGESAADPASNPRAAVAAVEANDPEFKVCC